MQGVADDPREHVDQREHASHVDQFESDMPILKFMLDTCLAVLFNMPSLQVCCNFTICDISNITNVNYPLSHRHLKYHRYQLPSIPSTSQVSPMSTTLHPVDISSITNVNYLPSLSTSQVSPVSTTFHLPLPPPLAVRCSTC